MPSVDESQVDRETYGNAPGWSAREGTKDAEGRPVTPQAQEEAPPAPDAEAAPSAEEPSQEQVSEQAPPPTSQPEPEKKFNMPPPERWEELRRDREEAKQRAEKAEQLAQMALQKLQVVQPTAQPEVDPYAGMDAPTAEFYRQMDHRIEQKAAALAEQKVQGILQAVNAGREELAAIKISQFRQANPDIKPGSPEELAIAGYVQQGYGLDQARKLALFDKLETENRALKGKQASVPRKVAAAQTDSSAGIPSGSGLPPRQGDWRQRAGEVLDKGGTMQDVLGIVFGGPRR